MVKLGWVWFQRPNFSCLEMKLHRTLTSRWKKKKKEKRQKAFDRTEEDINEERLV